jgi:hypothetical protein
LKAAKLAEAERKDALIDEGLSILSRLDADGKLTDDQKAWRESSSPCATAPSNPPSHRLDAPLRRRSADYISRP